MTNIEMLTYGGFVALVAQRQSILGLGWLLAMFIGVIPDNDAPLAFMLLMAISLFTKFMR